MRTIIALLALLGGVLGVDPLLYAAQRQELSLNGQWEVFHTESAASSPPDHAQWQKAAVPHLRAHDAVGGSEYTWYRRTTNVPAAWKGQRIVLLLVGARYDAHVYVNGAFVDHQLEGWTPFKLDITDHVTPGQPITLTVRCQDWGATFADGFTIPADHSGEWYALRAAPQGKCIAPIGGHFSWYGVWDDVVMKTTPTVYLYDVAIHTSIRNGTLIVKGSCVSGDSDVWVEGEVWDKRRKVLSLPGQSVSRNHPWLLGAPFETVHAWSPENPYLYEVRLILKQSQDGPVLDTYTERFGFREFWAEGPDFYLNGVKRHLLASSGWPVTRQQTDEEVRQSLINMKQGNNIAFRLHTQPWQRKWLRIADEVGMMIIEEGALWCDSSGGYGYQDERFWENTRIHLTNMVRRDRNHASLVMWSLENEILHCGAGGNDCDVEEHLAELGRYVKQLDPTHLITYEADHDPCGIADVIGLHYPHEMPQYTDYPNTADWLNQTVQTGTEGDLMGSRDQAFHWDRNKPLYIGEYLWVPWNDYSPGSVFFGDEAYIDRSEYKRRAKALAWKHQTLAYRRGNVSGTCPWTFAGSGGRFSTDSILYLAQKEVYEPVAVFPRELSIRFHTAEVVKRRFDLFNDSVGTLTLQLRCTLNGAICASSSEIILPPGAHKELTLSIPMPLEAHPEGMAFICTLLANGKDVHSCAQTFHIYERLPVHVPKGYDLLVYDPAHGWLPKIENLDCTRLAHLSGLTDADPETDLLVVGPKAFAAPPNVSSRAVIGYRNEDSGFLRAFLQRGGRVLVMEQDSLAQLSLGASLVTHVSTMTFPVAGEHPMLAGLNAEGFQFWRDNHYVSTRQILRPQAYGGKALLVSGGENSTIQSPLVEMRFGRGLLMLCQMLVGAKSGLEPAADRIVNNALTYLASYKPPAGRTVVLSEGPDAETFMDALEYLQLNYRQVEGPLVEGDFTDTSLLVLHGGGDRIAASSSVIKDFLENNEDACSVYWHAPVSEAFAPYRDTVNVPSLGIAPSHGPVTVRPTLHPAFSGVCRADLTYVGTSTGQSWMRGFDLDAAVVDRAVTVAPTLRGVNRYEIETWDLGGQIVKVTGAGKEVTFATGGTATGTARVAEPGIYRVTLVAGGTPAAGGWPQVRISANGHPVGHVELDQGESQLYAILAELPAGDITMELAFVNDRYINGEDRNLTVDALLIDRKRIDQGALKLLTWPPAVAVVDVSPSACIVLDGVRWDINPRNAAKGARYASVLLGNLGASFKLPAFEPAWAGPEHFAPVGSIPYFNKTSAHVALVAAGTVQAEFECIQQGDYDVIVRARSTPAEGIYAKARVSIDRTVLGEPEITSEQGADFSVGTLGLDVGTHRLRVQYTNDLNREGEDRNLYLQGIGFRPTE